MDEKELIEIINKAAEEQATELDLSGKGIKELPPERRKIRPNIEATVKEFTKAFNHKGKLKVRGFFKTSLYATASAIGINFGRIFRYQAAFST